MLVICNGAMKSGSTWLYLAYSKLHNANKIEYEHQNKAWSNSSFCEKVSTDILETYSLSNSLYVVKQHWDSFESSPIGFIGASALESLIVVNIYRDIRDVLISQYHQGIRLKRLPQDTKIDDFCVSRQRLIDNRIKYHLNWLLWAQNNPRNYNIFFYENLLLSVSDSIDSLGESYLSPICNKKELKKCFEDSHISNLMTTGKDTFFRRGESQSYLSEIKPETSAKCIEQFMELGGHQVLELFEDMNLLSKEDAAKYRT